MRHLLVIVIVIVVIVSGIAITIVLFIVCLFVIGWFPDLEATMRKRQETNK